jgi:hypothetical protein
MFVLTNIKKKVNLWKIIFNRITVRPKKLLRRKRLSAIAIKHVPSNIIKDRSALFGNWISSLVIDVELLFVLLFNKNDEDNEDCLGDKQS